MTDERLPVPYAAGVPSVPGYAPAAWSPAPPASEPSSGLSVARLLAAFKRYKWVMLAIVVLGAAGGAVAAKLVRPKYTARATVWISSETPLNSEGGPLQSRELLNSKAWVELLKSYRIADAVVTKLTLYVHPNDRADAAAFRRFALADRFVPGEYELSVDPRQRSYELQVRGTVAEKGTLGDSIGRKLGLRWAPTPQELRLGKDERTIRFTVATPRETAIDLVKRLNDRLPDQSNFLWLSIEDEDPKLAADILNTWTREYVQVAGDLKKRNIVEFANILRGQLAFAEQSLREAEGSLQQFRVQTITLPTENSPVVAGLEMTQHSAMGSYFNRKVEVDNFRHDREALEEIIAKAAGNTSVLEGAMLIPSVTQGQTGAALKTTFDQLAVKRAELAAARQVYTEEFKGVQQLAATVRRFETEVIPQMLNQTLASLRDRERQASARVESQTTDLRQIPTRTIEEMRLRRRVAVAEQLYTSLQGRYAGAHLAEASTTPDVSVLDTAVAPLQPSTDTALGLFGMTLLGSVGAAAAAAFLLDRTDRKVRYPEHASRELGLAILGAIPPLPPSSAEASPEKVAEVVEAIRSLRLSIVHALAGRPRSFAITSAGSGEGKSLVCSNLALSFAEAGFRTILVDADTRRGGLHKIFGVPSQPGLTDCLSGEASLEASLHSTVNDALRVIPCGTRDRRSPELLTSQAMLHLASELRERADIVIFDSPPLAAGIDAFAIGTAATHVLMVLRLGRTDRKLAAAKLELMDRLPVSMLGAALNDVKLEGEFQYYAYLEGYDARDAEVSSGRELVTQDA